MVARSILKEYYSKLGYNPYEEFSNLSDKEKRTYLVICNNPGISKLEMATSLCEANSNLNKTLSSLIKKSLIHIKGGTYYPMSSI